MLANLPLIFSSSLFLTTFYPGPAYLPWLMTPSTIFNMSLHEVMPCTYPTWLALAKLLRSWFQGWKWRQRKRGFYLFIFASRRIWDFHLSFFCCISVQFVADLTPEKEAYIQARIWSRPSIVTIRHARKNKVFGAAGITTCATLIHNECIVQRQHEGNSQSQVGIAHWGLVRLDKSL